MDFDVPWLEQENILQRYHAEIVELLKKATGSGGLLFWSPSGHRVMGDDKGCFGTGARGILFLPPAFLDSSQAYHLRRWHIIL